MATLLLLLACVPDPGTKSDDGANGGDDAPWEGADPAAGGWVYAYGAGGLWAQVSEGGPLEVLDTDAPGGANASGDAVTAWVDSTVSVYSRLDGAVVRSHDVDCGASSWVADALYHQGALLVACGANEGAGPVVRVEDDGTVVTTGAYASGFQADQGVLYLRVDGGREGEQLGPVDPVTLAALDTPRWLGFGAEARGDAFTGQWGEPGNSEHGGVTIGRWSEPSADASIDLGAGEFPAGVDVLYGRLALVSVWEQATDTLTGVLFDHTGARVDALPDCASPRLVWGEENVTGWCARPTRRYTWAWGDGGWARVGEDALSADATSIGLVEPGD